MQVLLSEHWHAVRAMRPRLRDGVLVLHRRLRGRPWVLLHDPVAQRFHRLPMPVWQVLQLLDGRRTLDEVWNQASAAGAAAGQGAGGEAWTLSQHELVQLLGSLHAQDLLQTQVAPDAAEVLQRHERQRSALFKQAWLNPMNLKLPLLHPDVWFSRRAGLARMLFSLPVLGLWLALVLPAGVLAAQHWDALTDNLSDRVLSASNLLLLWFIYPLVKAVHELAHGLAVKAWGGAVREIGLMFMIFTPVPYVDATASYQFPSKWARATVAAAGIMAELALGALAIDVWVAAQSGLVTALAFNVVLIAGVSTVLVNGNPLMRYDGYFVACDLLESPNLAQRASQYWVMLIDRHLLGAREAEAPIAAEQDRGLLLVYGAVAPLYRLFITFGLIWFVAAEYPSIGILMAAVSVWGALLLPLWRGWRHLTRGASLARRRGRALWCASALLATLLGLVVLLPVPFHSVHQGVVWLPEEAIVRAAEAGPIVAELAVPGQSVRRGQPLLQLDSAALLAEFGVAQARMAQTRARLRKAEVGDQVETASLRAQALSEQERMSELARRLATQQVRAGSDGRWVPQGVTERVGRYAQRGEVLGHVVDAPSRLVRCAVTQEDRDLIHARLQGVTVRLVQDLHSARAASLRREVPGGEFTLVSAALGSSGGGEIAVDPAQGEGTRSLGRVFDLEIALDAPAPAPVFGDRAYIRFDLGWAPLGWQAFLRLRQVFLARLNV
jgi:putative peptide zinc metalloprotease protein